LARFDPAIGPEQGVRGGHGVAAHRKRLSQLALRREMTPVDEVSLLGEPAKPIGQTPEEGTVRVVVPAEERRDLL
jgi:hypothetical protein